MKDAKERENRRSLERFRIPRGRPLRVCVARLGSAAGYCDVMDVSAGGIKIRSQQALYEGACVWVRLDWAGSSQTVLGEVHRVMRDGSLMLAAIKFDSPQTRLGEVASTLYG